MIINFDIVYNLSLLIAMSVLSGFVDNRWKRDRLSGRVMQGILFGGVALVGTFNAVITARGVIFDGRSVVLSLCAFFFGRRAGIIAALMAALYRIYLGGSGVWMGVAVIISATLIGIVFNSLCRKGIIKKSALWLYILGLIVHSVMLALMALLPSELRQGTFLSLSLTILAIYPLAGILIGKILMDQEENGELMHKLRKSRLGMQELNNLFETRIRERTAGLETANKELESFSYSVAHDLKAPLRAMGEFSDILISERSGKLDAQAREYLGRIRQASRTMAKLIEALFGLSHITVKPMKIKSVNLSVIAVTICRELKNSAPERKAEFVIQESLIVKGDETLLYIVMQNLLSNAWKFTSRHKSARIEVGSREQNGELEYFVRDDGAGFSIEDAKKLFGMFRRLHSKEEFPGTGIGLVTVKRIISRHGGRIRAEGELEKGASFYFTLN